MMKNFEDFNKLRGTGKEILRCDGGEQHGE